MRLAVGLFKSRKAKRLKKKSGADGHLGSSKAGEKSSLCCQSARELDEIKPDYSRLKNAYNLAVASENELRKENGSLRVNQQSLSDQITKEMNNFADLKTRYEELESFVRPLVEKLSPESQVYVRERGFRATWVLGSCFEQFGKLEKEVAFKREEHQREIWSLKESYKNVIDERERRYHEATKVLNDAHQKKADQLRNEVDRLQMALLTQVDHFQPMSDTAIEAKFTTLKKAVENLARCSLDVDEERLGVVFDRRDFIHATSRHQWRYLFESTFWTILIDGFYSSPFKVFGRQAEPYLYTWCGLFGEGKKLQNSDCEWLYPNPASEKWRSVTFEALRSGMQTINEDIRTSYEANHQHISEALSKALRKFSSEAKRDEIHNIVDQALRLAFDFGSQRCRLQLFTPRANEIVLRNTNVYRDANRSNDESIGKGTIQLVVAPGLKRTGDGRGYVFQESAVLFPATVYLEAVHA